MIKRVFSILLAISIIFSITYVSADDTKELTLTVDENTIVRSIDKKMYGINCEWGDNGDGSNVWMSANSESLEVNPAYIELFKDNLPFTRMAGMSANAMYWKKAIGTLEEREPLLFWYYAEQKQRYGPVEWIKGNQQADADTEFAYTVNLKDTENIADLVRFMTLNPSDEKAVDENGYNWAQRRVDLGIKDPVPIAVWELGNETDAGNASGGFTFYKISKYLPPCKEAIEAIKSVDPDAKISAHIKSDYTQDSDDWKTWHRTLLQEIGNDIDYLSIHTYYNWENVKNWSWVIDVLEEDIQSGQYTNNKDIKFYYSEHAANRLGKTWGDTFEYNLPHTLGGTLATAEFYLGIANRPSVEMATYHNMNSASWLAAYEYKNKVKLSAPGALMRIMQNNFCGDLLESSLEGQDETTENLTFAGAVKTEKGINVMLLNRSDKPVKYNLNLSKEYYLNKKSYITGPSNSADYYQMTDPNTGYDAMNHQDILWAFDESTIVHDIKEYTVAPYTMVMLNLQESKRIFACDDKGIVTTENDDLYAYKFTDESNVNVALSRKAFGGNETLLFAEYDGSRLVSAQAKKLPVRQYTKAYGATYGITTISQQHRSTMGESFEALVGEEIEGSTVGENDYVILKNADSAELNNFITYGNGLTNVFVWKENKDGTISKLYGGNGSFAEFKGYADNGTSSEFALAKGSKTTPLVYAVNAGFVGENSGGAFWFKPQNSQNYITFGREDLDMSGITTFKYKFSYYRDDYTKGVPQIHAYLTQGNNQNAKDCELKFNIFSIIGDGTVKDFDNIAQSNVKVGIDKWHTSASDYYTVTITIDNTGDVPTAKYVLSKNDGTEIHSTVAKNIGTGFDFTKDMGIKLAVWDEFGFGNSVLLGYYDMNASFAEEDKYTNISFDTIGGEWAKIFVFDSLNNLKPLSKSINLDITN